MKKGLIIAVWTIVAFMAASTSFIVGELLRSKTIKAENAIEIYKLLLSWPVVTILIILIVISFFGEELQNLISRIKKITFGKNEIDVESMGKEASGEDVYNDKHLIQPNGTDKMTRVHIIFKCSEFEGEGFASVIQEYFKQYEIEVIDYSISNTTCDVFNIVNTFFIVNRPLDSGKIPYSVRQILRQYFIHRNYQFDDKNIYFNII